MSSARPVAWASASALVRQGMTETSPEKLVRSTCRASSWGVTASRYFMRSSLPIRLWEAGPERNPRDGVPCFLPDAPFTFLYIFIGNP